MAFSNYITAAERDDINEAADYYNKRAAGFGFKFSKDVEGNLNTIPKNPNAFGERGERFNNVRGKLLQKKSHILYFIKPARVNNVWRYLDYLIPIKIHTGYIFLCIINYTSL
jgi:hypothetical protein